MAVNLNEHRTHLTKTYGVEYFEPGSNSVVEAKETDLYFYKTFIGQHKIDISFGDCAFYLCMKSKTAFLKRGPATIETDSLVTVIRGYMPENKTSGLFTDTYLPYVNGCSTKQIFPPERLGDPTLQVLNIPPHSAEQAHHIHSTVRIVYVLSGKGRSIVGMDSNTVSEDLYSGKCVVLQKMCPHHFETDDEHLVVIPLHVFSSIGGMESNHPMFNGTHLMNQK